MEIDSRQGTIRRYVVFRSEKEAPLVGPARVTPDPEDSPDTVSRCILLVRIHSNS